MHRGKRLAKGLKCTRGKGLAQGREHAQRAEAWNHIPKDWNHIPCRQRQCCSPHAGSTLKHGRHHQARPTHEAEAAPSDKSAHSSREVPLWPKQSGSACQVC